MKTKLKMLRLLAVLCCLALPLLTSCGECKHKETEWIDEIEATCAVAGTRVKTCTKCGAEVDREQYSTGHRYQSGACIYCGRAELGSNYYEYREITLDGVTGYEVVYYGNSTAVNVEIPALRNGKPVLSVAAGAFQNNKNITSLTVSRNVRQIGEGAFAGCELLETVTFHESSELTVIGESAFAGCVALRSFAFPVGVTAIPALLFEGCTALTTVVLHDGILSLGEDAFADCENIAYSEVDDAKYLGTENTPHLLFVCVTDKTVTDFTVPADTKIVGAGAFAGCTELETVSLPEGVLSLGISAFSGCEALQEITLPATLQKIEPYAFAGCTALRSIDIPVATAHIGEHAFDGCAALSEIILPNGVKTVGSFAFLGTALTYTEAGGGKYLGNAENPYVVLVDTVAEITALTIHDETRVIANGALADSNAVGDLTVIEIGANIQTIGTLAFAGCTSLAEVTFAAGEGWLAAMTYEENAVAMTVSDPAANAAALTGAYKYYYWYR